MRDKTPSSVLAKQLDLLYQSLPPALLASAFIPVLFLIFLKDFPVPWALRTWVFLMLLVIFFRTCGAIHYHKTKQSDTFQYKQAERLFIIGVILGALVWGSLSWWIYPLTNDQSIHFLFFISMLGVAGGSVASLAYRRITGYLFISLSLFPMFIGMYRAPGGADSAIGIIILIYIMYLFKSIRFFQENSEKVLLLKERALAREATLKIARQKAEAANRAKSRFLANMSHEIRTPMNSIIGQTQLAIDGEHDPKIKSHLDIIKNSSANLLILINDILDFSKIEAGELKIENKPFDLYDTVHSVFDTIRVLAKENKFLQLTCTIASDVPQAIIGDSLRLRQILLNLLNNSVKFTPEGSIELSVKRLLSVDEALQLQFKVCDTGIGIALDKQKHIFKEFAQEDDSSTRRYGGTGLGLAICKQLCNLMKGDIDVISTPKQGSTFTCRLAFKSCELSDLTPVTPPPAQIDQSNTPSLSLLVVEDNASNRLLISMVLEAKKHKLMEAYDGLQALNMLVDHTFDAILMDVQMPVMDGYEATKAIRAAERGMATGLDSELSAKLTKRLMGHHTPIIAMTANAMSGDREKCLAAEMDEYISKPFYPEELSATFDKMNIGHLKRIPKNE